MAPDEVTRQIAELKEGVGHRLGILERVIKDRMEAGCEPFDGWEVELQDIRKAVFETVEGRIYPISNLLTEAENRLAWLGESE